MKLTFKQLGIASIENSVEHLRADEDRHLMAGVVLGHHGITCLMKAAAQTFGIVVQKGSSFSEILGHLNKQRTFVKGETKALELLNKVRNDIEHDEPDFVRDEFEVALTDCLHIVERLSGVGLELDLQAELSDSTWEYLIEIGKFGKERRQRLLDLLQEELGVYHTDLLEIDYEFISCWECGELGLLWEGQDEADVKCKFCGQITTLRRCEVCQSVIYPFADSVFEGTVHKDCFDRWGE